MSYKYDLTVFIGRFQPFHNGHMKVVETALTQSAQVLILTGSSYQPRTPRNPWNQMERADMIADALSYDSDAVTKDRVWVRGLRDQRYMDQKWVEAVQTVVAEIASNCERVPRIAIIGHSKDETSYYLKMFPQWDQLEHEMVDSINATDVRNIIYEGKNLNYLTGIVPKSVHRKIVNFVQSPEYEYVHDYYKQVKANNKKWDGSPYAPTFVTTDAVIVQSGHILLVTRKSNPGMNLLALPGGYLNPKELIIDGMIRELREETKLKVPVPVLKGSIKAREVYDDPNRSDRGRIITHAFLIELPPGELPKVKGSDDAKHADWYPLSKLTSENMFEDHYSIIQHITGQL
jgi:bifunctional NMN adenylyltransferase/nudix hydrolase